MRLPFTRYTRYFPRSQQALSSAEDPAAVRRRLLASLGKGATAGLIFGLVLLLCARTAGADVSPSSGGLFLFGCAGWCGVVVYFARLLTALLY